MRLQEWTKNGNLEPSWMRNLIWLLAVLGFVALAVRFYPCSPASTATPQDVSVCWQEWDKNGLSFTFVADGSGIHFKPAWIAAPASRQVVLSNQHNLEPKPGSMASELHALLRKQVDAALEEPCQGSKTKELTLREGSKTWTVEIGAVAGPAQTRILRIMEAPMAEYRALAQPSSKASR